MLLLMHLHLLMPLLSTMPLLTSLHLPLTSLPLHLTSLPLHLTSLPLPTRLPLTLSLRARMSPTPTSTELLMTTPRDMSPKLPMKESQPTLRPSHMPLPPPLPITLKPSLCFVNTYLITIFIENIQ